MEAIHFQMVKEMSLGIHDSEALEQFYVILDQVKSYF